MNPIDSITTLTAEAQSRLTACDYPVALDDSRLGLSGDTEVADIVHRTLSSALLHPIDRRGTSTARRLSYLLLLYGTGNESDPLAPFPDLGRVPLTTADRARRLLGITFDDERERWERLIDAGHPVWPVEQLCAYVPTPLWRVVERIVIDGRQGYAARVRMVLEAEATRSPMRPSHKRHDGGRGTVSPAWMKSLRFQATNLARPLHDLASLEPFATVLSAGGWDKGNPLRSSDFGGSRRAVTRGATAKTSVVTDTSAPPLRLVRLRFAEVDEQIRQRLDRNPGDDEVSLIQDLPESQLTRSLEQLLRDRLLLLWLPRFAQRAGAFPYLSEACIDVRHTFVDHEVGPGVLVFDPKTPTSARWRWRPFEAELVPLIAAYQAIKRRRTPIGMFVDDRSSDGRNRPDVIDVPEDARAKLRAPFQDIHRAPALFRTTMSLKPVTPSELQRICTGVPSKRQPPLVPRPDRPQHGYNPHALARHLHRTLVSSDAALRWCDLHGHDASRRDVWGRMSLDHDLEGLDALYRDDDSDLGREMGTRLGGRVVWEQLTTDLGLRTHRDGETYRKALKARDHLSQDLRDIEDQAEAATTDLPAKTVVTLLRRARELTDMDRTIMAIETGHEDYLVRVPDEVPPEDVPRVDLAQIKREHAAGVPRGRVQALRSRRNFYTVQDLVELAFGGRSTVSGWLKAAVNGRPLPRNAPFAADAVVELQQTRRVVYAAAVSFATKEQADLGAAILSRDNPPGWEHLPSTIPDPRRQGGRPLRLVG